MEHVIHPTEQVLDDNYEVYGGYWYVCDGVPRECEIFADYHSPAVTVFEMRIAMNVGEVRNCDLKARGML